MDEISLKQLNNEDKTQPGGENPGCIKISVRSLVEFLLRNGDINNRKKGGRFDTELMLEGANAHRAFQRRQKSGYRSEVPLYDVIERDGYDIIIEGRADGIYEEVVNRNIAIGEEFYPKRRVTIDEIKTSHRHLDFIKKPDIIHLAQAKCYAYMHARDCGLSEISVRITYINLDTNDCKFFYEDYTWEEISTWYNELLDKYYRWTDFAYYWKKVRNRSIEQLKFPFIYRTGQRELVAQVYKSITGGEKLYIQAPTGVGKTISTIYPALKAMGEGRCEKIFYLTAKTITRTVAAECFQILRQQPFSFKSVILTAKDKICPLSEPDCNPDTCAYAKGHFDRINDAIYDILTNSDNFSREDIEAVSIKHRVCPFELSLDLSLFSDAIICDYNYVFDPNVYLKRYFADVVTDNYYFLVDEAHNLVDRAMSMYSAELYKEQFLEVRRIVKDKNKYLGNTLNNINKMFLEVKRDCEDTIVLDSIDNIIIALGRLYSQLDDFLENFEKFDEREVVLNFFFDVRHFYNMFENMGPDDYVIYAQIVEDGRFMIKLLCADPSESIKRCTQRAVSSIFFSATLLPITYYRQMLGALDYDNAVYAKSVFDPNKRGLFVANDVTSKYTRRNRDEYARIARYIKEVVSAKKGNYLIFCPSHYMLEQIYDIYMDLYFSEEEEYLVQSSSMGEMDREDFIRRFESGAESEPESFLGLDDSDSAGGKNKTLLGFCVLGGIFSEGIDLKKDALIGTIIVGTGLPMVCPERNILKDRYMLSGYDGFAYAYRYPGMNKVLQAAGRVIRTAEDRGVVVLLDERFLSREYLSMFPREWSNYRRVSVDTIGDAVEAFWRNVN